MSIDRALVASIIFLAATAPAFAGGGLAERGAGNGALAPIESCPHSKALNVLVGNQMTLVAEVPRAKRAYRFVVDYKEQLFAVTVRTSDCAVDVVDYAAAIRPYCAYIPGIRIACPPDQLMQ